MSDDLITQATRHAKALKNTWKKHDGSTTCPEDEWAEIEVETYTGFSIKEFASSLEWEYVKFYRVIEDKLK